MKQHVLESLKNHPWEWASCAALAGCVLSRIAARDKKDYIEGASQKPAKSLDQGPLGKVWREVWQFSKPMIAAYLVKLLAKHIRSPESK